MAAGTRSEPPARKRFGQHFLKDERVLDRLVSAMRLEPGEHLLEIGPGRGALTDRLLAASVALEVIEIDRDLVSLLKTRYAGVSEKDLRIHEGDILKMNLAPIAGEGPVRIVGNLPYNISTPLLFRLFTSDLAIADMHFMLQQEVVERLAADPGSRTYGRLSVLAQYHCDIMKCFTVDAASFSPPPKVTSAVVRLVPRAFPAAGGIDEGVFRELVTRAFTKRRKFLSNALKDYLTMDAIAATGIDPKARAETLSIQNYLDLARRVAGSREGDT